MKTVLLLFGFLLPIQAYTTHQMNELKRKLLKDYDKNTIPHTNSSSNNDEDRLLVVVRIHPITIGELDEINEQLSSVFGFLMTWHDSSIKWDADKHFEIKQIIFGDDEVWKPRIMLANPHQQNIHAHNYVTPGVVRYDFTGFAVFTPMFTAHSKCDIDTTYFPFDVQSCNIVLNIALDTTNRTRINCEWTENDLVRGNEEWKLINESISNELTSVTITLTFARKPMFMLLNILLPLVVLVTLTPMVFLLPKGSGERIAYSLTMLLSISVYMTIVNEHLPKNSDPMPLISVMIFIWYILTALIVLIVICNIQISRIKYKRRIPGCVCGFVKLTRWINRKKTLSYSACAEETEPCLESKNINGDETCVESLGTPLKITWVEVSVAIDKWCFVGFYIIKFIVPVVCIAVMSSMIETV